MEAATIQAESLATFRADAEPLLAANAAECFLPLRLDVNWDAWSVAEAAGQLVCLTARIGGVLAGYSVFVVTEPALHQGHLLAVSQAFYVAPAHRVSTIFPQLLDASEMGARNCGASGFAWQPIPGSTFELWLQRRGARHVTSTYLQDL